MNAPNPSLHQRILTARLPALPQVLVRFLELSRRDDTGFDEIARLISQDAAMTAKILTVAGSASQHQTLPTKDLSQCLLKIGLDAAKYALVAESIHQVFDALVTTRPVNLGGFWQQSLTTAILARRIAKETAYPFAEEAYLAGLLHNVGQLALLSTLPDQYSKAFAQGVDDDWLANWETLSLGLTHAEVGAWLCGRWRLDTYLADAILYHHEPQGRLAGAHPLVRITWLAHALAHDSGADVSTLGVDSEMSLRVQEGVPDEVQSAATLLGISLTPGNDPAATRGQLADAIRTMTLAGAQQEIRISPQQDFVVRLQAVMTAARSLYGFGDGILFQPKNGKLTGRVAWQYLSRLEELEVPVGREGGAVGVAAATGRLTTTWDENQPVSVLDKQLQRALDGEGLFCLPLTDELPATVLAFAMDSDSASKLESRLNLIEMFEKEAKAALNLAVEKPTPGASVSTDRLRRAVHEMNNPLGIIRNYLHMLGEQFAGQDTAKDIALVNAEIDRVGRILDDLVAPKGERDVPEKKQLNLNEVVRDLVAFCRDTAFIPDRVQLELSLADNLPAVHADSDSLKQILLNLLKNAIEETNDRCQIGINTTGPIYLAGISYVLLRIFDNGPGIPPELRQRIFQPVETQKGEGHAGLGLAIVAELVDKLHGRIKCSSSDLGTSFDILLPAYGQNGDQE